MASSSNQEQRQNRVSSPQDPLLQDPLHDRDLPPNPPVQSTQLDSETTSQNQLLTEPTVATNPTTITSVLQDKSAPNSFYDPPQPDGRLRVHSSSIHEHDRNGVSRYPTVTRPRSVLQHNGSAHRQPPGLEWIVPTAIGDKRREKTAGERLEPTLDVARAERDTYAARANRYGMSLNIAIGLQVIVGALTTGVAAATTGRSTSIGVSILGGISTILASFLARSRGSNEPDYSNLRARELGTFVREAEAWIMDNGHGVGPEYDERINMFRERFEQIIKTDGEDSASGNSFGTQQTGAAKPNATPTAAPGQQWHGNEKASEKV